MTAFKVVSHERVAKDDKNAYDFSISRYEKKETRFMQRSVFGLFTALLGVLCVLSAIPAFRKKRYGLAVFSFKCFYQPCQYYSRLLWHPILEKSEE